MAAKEGLCRYCGQLKPLVKAHIIPEAFFRAIGTGKNAPILVTDRSDSPFPKRIPIGIYDNEILCDCCERKFDRLDAYGTKTLLHTLRGEALKPIRHKSLVIGFEASGIDQEFLLRFFTATLWRASVSRNLVFDRVSLGARYEVLAKEAVSERALSLDFGAVLATFKSPEGKDRSIGLMDPIRQRYGGVNVYRFYFGPYHAHIKVDRRPFEPTLRVAALCQSSRLRIVRRDFNGSKDFEAMKLAAVGQHRNSIDARQRLSSREVN